jgi:hypothetical protein
MTCYNSELPIGPPGPTGPQGEPGPGGELLYKVYTVLLTQTGTDAPVPNVLEDTLNETGFEFLYADVGSFIMQFPDSTYLGSKLVIFCNTLNIYQGPVSVYHAYTDNYVAALIITTPGGGPSLGNSCLKDFAIEIRYYL